MVVLNMLGLVVYVLNNGENLQYLFRTVGIVIHNTYMTPLLDHNNYNKNWHLSVSYLGLRSIIHYRLALLPL